MLNRFLLFSLLKFLFLSLFIVLSGCNKDNENGQAPKIPDKNSVGCLITNDFYAVHFSAYLKPTGNIQGIDKAALLRPFCRELPTYGQVFFGADLIDKDIREKPIGARVIELEKPDFLTLLLHKTQPTKEIRTLLEVPAQVYAKGVVEANANIDKDGYYALELSIGGEEALSEEDHLKIPFYVGKAAPLKILGYPLELAIAASAGVILLLSILFLIYRIFCKRRKNNPDI